MKLQKVALAMDSMDYRLNGNRHVNTRAGFWRSEANLIPNVFQHTSNAQEQVVNVASLKGTLEKTRPVGLNLNLSGVEERRDLLGSHGDSVVVEDQSSVGAGEFRTINSYKHK